MDIKAAQKKAIFFQTDGERKVKVLEDEGARANSRLAMIERGEGISHFGDCIALFGFLQNCEADPSGRGCEGRSGEPAAA